MKLECVREQLTEAVSITERIARHHPTLPILNHLFLSVKNNSLTIRSTNLELGIEVTLPVKAVSEGIVAVPAETLLNTLINTYHTSISLEVKNNTLSLKTPTSETLITTTSPDDFPTLPTLTGKPLRFKGSDFLKGIKSVWYSASASTMKPELGSVYVRSEGPKMAFVPTDSFRLPEKIVPTKQPSELKPFLLPVRVVPEVLRVLERTGEDMTVRVDEHQISFHFNDIYLTSRTMEGTFPDYHQIIPKEKATEAVLLKQDLLLAFKKALVFSGKFNQVGITVYPKKKQFVISAKSDVGETTDTVTAAVSGEDVAINFNLKYLADCFQAISGDSVSLTFNGSGKPLVIRDVSDTSFLYLVMPMNR